MQLVQERLSFVGDNDFYLKYLARCTDSASVFGMRRPTLGLFVIYRVLVSHQANEQLILGHIVNIHSIRITHFIGSILLLYNVNNIQIKNIYFNES